MRDDIPYLLLTPGPVTTTAQVKAEMQVDLSTWDRDYNDIVQEVRRILVALATNELGYTSVLMQGSGTFSVEATIGSVIPPAGKLLVVNNGAYGARIAAIAERLKIPVTVVETFRIGTIGDLTADDVDDLLVAINESVIALKKCTTN